jgi:MarR family transcriptional regulator, organic hydroperoxide resistance regulator
MSDQTVNDWQLLSQVSQIFRSLTDSFMSQVETHRAQGILLCQLAEKDGITQSEIAEQMSVQGATVTNMLQRMEESGTVIRRRDSEDNRLVRVYLTEAGREKEQAIHARFVELEAQIFAGVPDADREQLRRILMQLLQNMEKG